jgi:hypothetical protein
MSNEFYFLKRLAAYEIVTGNTTQEGRPKK